MMDRRNFLKTTAVAGVSSTTIFSSVLGKNLKLTTEASRINSSHWGVYYAVVKHGKVVGLKFPFFAKERYMSRGVVDRLYANRVKYPLVRKSFLKDGHKSDRSLRGREEFVRVSWDEAATLVAREIKRVQAKREEKNIFTGSYGWHSLGKLTRGSVAIQRLLNLTGGSVRSVGNYSNRAVQAITPYVTGTDEAHALQTDWDLIFKHADNIVFWGCDIYKNNQIDYVAPSDYGISTPYRIIKESKRRKINKIFIDPIANETQKILNKHHTPNVKHIKPIPNTDITIMFAIAHYLYVNKKYDADYVDTYTVGFNIFIKYIMGKTGDKVVKDAKWASKISGLSESEIIKLAKSFVNKKTMFMIGWAMQRADHGEQPSWMVILLAAMLGQIGKAGTGFGCSYNYASGGYRSHKFPGIVGLSPNILHKDKVAKEKISNKESKYDTDIPVVVITDMLLNPGKVIKMDGREIKYNHIDMIYWAGGNPFIHQMDTNRLYEAWNSAEVTIVNDIYMSSVAMMADIVLPACSEFEKNDITSMGSFVNSRILAIKKVIEPYAESKNDYAICLEIAKKLGMEEAYSEGRSEMEWLEYLYNKSVKNSKVMDIYMPSFKLFWEKGYVYFPKNSKKYNKYGDFYKDPDVYPLGTESGKIQFYSFKIKDYNYKECKAHPIWMEPIEYLGNRKDDSYLHLLSPHPKYRMHSQLNNSKSLRAKYEIHGREPLFMNKNDANKRGIKHGDIVRVFNDRGSVFACANLNEDVRDEVVALEEGAWLEPIFKDGKFSCNHGDVNLLTIDKGTSELSQGNIANSALVKVEKYEGKLEPVKLFK